MNEIINKFLLAGDKFLPQMHLRQPGFTCSARGIFTKTKERIQKFKEAGDLRYIYQIELYYSCFQHDVVYRDFINLARITASDKVLHDKAFNIAKNLKYDGYPRGLASMVNKFFDKKIYGSGIKNEDISNNELAEESHKPIIRKLKKRKVESAFIGSIWGADLADNQLISKFNKAFRFLLCVIDIYSKYAWVITLKNKKGITIY